MQIPGGKAVGWTAAVSSVLGIFYGLNPTSFVEYASAAIHNQIAQAGFFFMWAARIHAGQVRKEIRAAVADMTDSMTRAINNVATALRQDLKAQTERLDNLATRVDALEITKNP